MIRFAPSHLGISSRVGLLGTHIQQQGEDAALGHSMAWVSLGKCLSSCALRDSSTSLFMICIHDPESRSLECRPLWLGDHVRRTGVSSERSISPNEVSQICCGFDIILITDLQHRRYQRSRPPIESPSNRTYYQEIDCSPATFRPRSNEAA